MERLTPLNPYTNFNNVSTNEIKQVVSEAPKAVNQHAEEIEKLQQKVKELEKIIEVLQAQIDELKATQETELIAQVLQAPPAYKN